MLRSLLNSARGRSALNAAGAPAAVPYILPNFTPQTPAEPELPPVTASAATIRPERCCIYCGNPLYIPPRVPRIRCPRCFQDLPVRDLTLEGEVTDPQIVTAGKITVAEGARVQSRLVACMVDVAGMVLGDILASQTCHLHPTARIAGRILCRRLDCDPGAQLEGDLELIHDPPAATTAAV